MYAVRWNDQYNLSHGYYPRRARSSNGEDYITGGEEATNTDLRIRGSYDGCIVFGCFGIDLSI